MLSDDNNSLTMTMMAMMVMVMMNDYTRTHHVLRQNDLLKQATEQNVTKRLKH